MALVDTDVSKGTRFSAGKPSLIWAPLSLLLQDKFFPEFARQCRAAIVTLHDGVTGCHPDRDLYDSAIRAASELTVGLAATDALFLVAEVSTMGASKYAPLDWYEGQMASTLINSALRHLVYAGDHGPLWAVGCDPESGLPHYGHALWNLMTLVHILESNPELDDVTCYQGVVTRDMRWAEEEAKRKGLPVYKVLQEGVPELGHHNSDSPKELEVGDGLRVAPPEVVSLVPAAMLSVDVSSSTTLGAPVPPPSDRVCEFPQNCAYYTTTGCRCNRPGYQSGGPL